MSPALTLDNITLSFPARVLIDGGSLSIPAGRLVALIGRNGAGKSTLLRTICGQRALQGGAIMLCGQSVRLMKPEALARTLAMVTTERVRVAALRVRDVVGLGRAPYTDWIGRLTTEDEAVVGRALSMVGMADYCRRTLDSLSDGECQRVMIARALAQQTPVMLLDEPTSFLDLPSRHELVRLLVRLAHEEGKCVLFSTHELDIALNYCDDIALIADKTITLRPAAELKASGEVERVFGLRV